MDIRKIWAWFRVAEVEELSAVLERYKDCLAVEQSHNQILNNSLKAVNDKLKAAQVANKQLEEDYNTLAKDKERERQEFTVELLAQVKETKRLAALLARLQPEPLFIAPAEEVKNND